ncbi:M16 family metallopeptidase [Paraliomyxa miuraensis]|uniref:M16 family metallopeptidase n=1 Tax=Paraliomyxa miuraensis TaxID=376150 RepID=UPI00225C2173|nr:pitrilysin family protein [Paraliomyxa miuraensis]MCX4243918.1 insulinase family protein [Paraliomyxa miuraensis]
MSLAPRRRAPALALRQVASLLAPTLALALSTAACQRGVTVMPEEVVHGTPPTDTKAAADVAPPKQLHTVEGITEYELANGMRVLLFPDPSRERVTVNVTYMVGSRHEGYGETGMAHLLEHMLFKGTPTHQDPWQLLQDHGAQFNGTTWYDRTNYYETMPASDENLEWALRFEADRMINSSIDPKQLAKEFSVVRNEFEMGENYAPGVLDERMLSTAFLWHNYGKSTIGSRSDIENVPVSALRAFYEKYYQPDNAVLVVAGAFEAKRALELVQECFATIPRPQRTLPPTYTVEPVQDGERTVNLQRVGDVGVVGVLFHGVAGADPDYVAGEALVHALTDEPSGRLYKALVEPGIASAVYGHTQPLHDPGWVQFSAEVPPGKPVEPVRERLLELIAGVADTITEEEVERFRNRQLKNIELALTDSTEIAIELTEWAALGDWRMFFVHRDRVEQINAAQVKAFAKRYVKPSNRTVGMFLPTKAPDRAPLTTGPDVMAYVDGYQGRGALREGEAFAATIANIEAKTVRDKTPGGIALALLPKQTRGGAVTMRIRLRAGSLEELRGKTAAAGLVGDMVMRGTTKHSRQELRDELDRLKAQVYIGGSDTGAWVYVNTVSDSVPGVVALLAEMLREPTFPAKELEVLRQEQLAALQEAGNEPGTRSFEHLFRTLGPYPASDPRYRATVEESIVRLKKVKRADLVSVHQRLWGAGDMQISVVGDFDAKALRTAVEQHLEGWAAKRPYQRLPDPFHDVAGGTPVYIDTPDKENAMVVMGQTMKLRDDDPDYAALVLANHVLGGAVESRLMERLRQKEGWSYGAFSFLSADSFDASAQLVAGAQCAPQNADKVLQAMTEELQRLVRDGVTKEELEAAKASYKAAFDTSLSSDDTVADQHLEDLFLGRTMAFTQKLNDAIAALTPEQVRAALVEHVRMDRFVAVVAGDLAKAGRSVDR